MPDISRVSAFAISLYIVITACGCTAPLKDTSAPFALVRLDGSGSWNIVSADGTILRQCVGVDDVNSSFEFRYLDAGTIVPVMRDDAWVFMSEYEIIGEHRYEAHQSYACGLAAVQRDGLWGYIDKDGKNVVPFRYSMAFPHSWGLAWVLLEGQWQAIDLKGHTVFKLDRKFRAPLPFACGLARVHDGKMFCFVNREGNLAFSQRFDWAGSFSDCLTAVLIDGAYGFADIKGHVAISPEYEHVSSFASNRAFAKSASGKLCILTPSGKELPLPRRINEFVQSENLRIRDLGLAFSEGLCPIRIGEREWMVIDTNGHIAFELQCDVIFPFSLGRAVAIDGQRIFCVGQSGDVVWERKGR